MIKSLSLALLGLASTTVGINTSQAATATPDPQLETAIVQVLTEEGAEAHRFLTCSALDAGMHEVVEKWWRDETLKISSTLWDAKRPFSPEFLGKVPQLTRTEALFDPKMPLADAIKLCAYPVEQSEKNPLYRFLVFDFPRPAERIAELIKAARPASQ